MVLQWIATGSVRAHSKAVSALCVLDGCLASGGSDASVKIWNISADDCSGTKYTHSNMIFGLRRLGANRFVARTPGSSVAGKISSLACFI